MHWKSSWLHLKTTRGVWLSSNFPEKLIFWVPVKRSSSHTLLSQVESLKVRAASWLMSSECLCVGWRRVGRGEWKSERMEGIDITQECWARWKSRGRVGGSKGLVSLRVKSISLISSSATVPLSLGRESWVSRVCLCPPSPPLKTVPRL